MHAALAGGPLPAPPSNPPAALLQNTVAVANATICNDIAWPRSIPGYQRAVTANRRAYPLTAGMPVNIFTCAYWPAPLEPPIRVTADGPSNMLLVQNERDPATPLSGARQLRAALGDRARMVIVASGGHGSCVAKGNACGDRTVSAFLATGVRPAHDAYCRG
jgi:hypothetical protein